MSRQTYAVFSEGIIARVSQTTQRHVQLHSLKHGDLHVDEIGHIRIALIYLYNKPELHFLRPVE
jgi:hypothetical protein